MSTHPRHLALHPRGNSARGGFTIVEVVIAMGIFLIGMSSLLGLLAFGATLTRHAALRGDAAAAIEAVVADLEEGLFPIEEDGTIGDPLPIRDRALPAHPGMIYSATTRTNPEDEREVLVEVHMAWLGQGVRHTKTFTTLLLREVPFGERLRRQFVAPPEPEGSVETTEATPGG